MSFFEENTGCLKQRFPGFENEVLSRFKADSALALVETDSGFPSAVYRGRLLHSRQAPLREAERIAEREDLARASCVIITGFGLGYLAEACLTLNPGISVVIMEPDIPLFLASLSSRPLSRIFTSQRISLLLNADPEVLFSLLSAVPPGPIKLVKFRPLYENHKAYYDHVETVIASFINRREINENTLKRFGHVWVRNMFRNLSGLMKARPVMELYGLFSGTPALVLAAGPSLDLLMPHLKNLRDKFLIIAVDTSLNACVLSGVEPDFLIVVDPQYWNTRHLDKMALGSCAVVSELSTHPAVFRKAMGQLYFCSSIFPLSRYFEEVLGDWGRLGAGGSVSTTAWDFARLLGCRPILFAGLDLGFPDKATHYRGSFFEERSQSLAGRMMPPETLSFSYITEAGPFADVNNLGGRTLTDRRLSLYRWWFENQLTLYPGTDTGTLSAKGLAIKNMPLVDLENLYERPDIRKELDPVLRNLGKEPAENAPTKGSHLVPVMERLAEEMTALKHYAEKALALTGTLATARSGINDAGTVLGELNRIDGHILASVSRDIAGFLVQESARGILSRASAETTMEKLTEETGAMYREIMESADFHLSLLRTSLTQITRID